MGCYRESAMRNIFFILMLLSFPALYAQDEGGFWDIDKDGIQDSITLDSARMKIICKLSTQDYKPIESLELDNYGNLDYIMVGDEGFSYTNNWMRAGYSCYFAYDEEKKRIRLVSMTRYEFGNAVGDGRGESGVDLLTGEYEGDWSYADYEISELFDLPTIKEHMPFPTIYLEDFSDETYFDFAKRCAALFHKYTKIHREGREKDQ